MLKRDVSPWGEGNFSGILPLQDGSAQAPQGRLLSGQHQPFLGSSPHQLLHIFATSKITSLSRFFSFFLHLNMHLSTYTHNKCLILLMAQKTPHDWCHSGTILSASNAIQLSQSVISRPVIPMEWNDEQQEESGELSLKRGASVKMSGSLWRSDAHQLFCLAVLGWKAF